MALQLLCPSYRLTNHYFLYGGLFEYIYGKTVEQEVEDTSEEDDDDEIKWVVWV